MPKKTKDQKDKSRSAERKTEKKSNEDGGAEKKGNWSEDQKEKSYYYDDSYGYEIYNPDDDDLEETEA